MTDQPFIDVPPTSPAILLRLIDQFADDNAGHLALVASYARNPRPTNDLTAREAELRQLAGDHGLAIEETTDPNEDDPHFRTYAVIGREGIDTLDDGLTLDEVAAFLAGYSHQAGR